MTTYTFSVSSGVATNDNITLITSDIGASAISVALTSITAIGDTLEIIFASPLSASEIVILSNIIRTYDLSENLGSQTLSFTLDASIRSTAYSLVSRVTFPGSNIIRNITNIKFCGSMTSTGTSYSVRLYDFTNNAIIASGTFTNTEPELNDLTGIDNIPIGIALFELQCKVVGNTKATINCLTIHYN